MYVIAHYHEVALKGRNRPFFVARLLENVRRVLRGVGLVGAREAHNSILLELEDQVNWDEARPRLQRVFGLVNFSRVERCPLELEAIKSAVRRLVEQRTFHTFRIDARRADKRFPMTSNQLNHELGAFVQSFTGAPVSLKQADLTVYVDILAREALVYGEKVPGPGGLPVGSGGRLVGLLSGGIDSPVAAHRMMRRGCRVDFVHFHSYPFLDASSRQKAEELVDLLDHYQGDSRLFLVPFGEAQRQVVLNAPEPYRTIIYRRLMVRIAGRIARSHRALALVTGDSLGQVASQTLENMAVIESASELPILRPLVGMDKQEIVHQAQQVGTFATSIQPDQDCCQLFMPRRPATRATETDLRRAEQHLDCEELVRQALAEVELVEYRGGRRRKTQVSGVGGQVSGVGRQVSGVGGQVSGDDETGGRSDGRTTQERAEAKGVGSP